MHDPWTGAWSGPWDGAETGAPTVSRPTCLTCPYWDATDAVRQNVATAKNVYYIANCIRFPAPGVRKQAGETCGEHNQFPAYVAGFKPPTVP